MAPRKQPAQADIPAHEDEAVTFFALEEVPDAAEPAAEAEAEAEVRRLHRVIADTSQSPKDRKASEAYLAAHPAV